MVNLLMVSSGSVAVHIIGFGCSAVIQYGSNCIRTAVRVVVFFFRKLAKGG